LACIIALIEIGSYSEQEFNWLSRLTTALGIATGLEYLHVGHSLAIIHRDLKPENILLDNNMEARIANFGLARTMSESQSPTYASNSADTIEYMTPEHHNLFIVNDKIDIYSFGIILAVLVIGKLPYDAFFRDTMSLVDWLRNTTIIGNFRDLIDPRLIDRADQRGMPLNQVL